MIDRVGPEDVRAAAAFCRQALSGVVDLDWSCLRTLEHISNGPLIYASELAFTAEERLSIVYDPRGEDQLTIPDLLLSAEVNAAILEHVIRAAPASTQAFHHSWMVDPSGFARMAYDEIPIHTADIASGFEIEFQPPEELSSRALTRLFPEAPTGVAP